jgi:acetoin utilization protein AcuB
MLVRDIMSGPVISISPETELRDAYRLMQESGIRHLPVMEGGRLAGIITDRDLRLATSALALSPFAAEDRVSAVMRPDPVTADPLDPVEDAARVMREKGIGCLPVFDDGALVGIVTGPDLLDALIRMTGVDKPSGRLEVKLADRPGELARLTRIMGGRDLAIHSILTYPDGAGASRTVLRIGSIETRALADDLRREGFDVLWPPDRPWPR